MRSYLGKAYFEERRSEIAASQYAMAKELDSQDPTPWFYNAILMQTSNRPVEALEDMQEAIKRNDNRVVYRSRLALDSDLAVRGVSLVRIYDDLGFNREAELLAAQSIDREPGNASAHRFLADSYRQRPHTEIARVSEVLQTQLLQPLSIDPVPPQMQETNLNILARTGSSRAGFNEYTPLFARNGVRLSVTGLAGNDDTLGDELVVAALVDRLSLSFGQFHFKTDGFREDNDVTHDLYNLYVLTAYTVINR